MWRFLLIADMLQVHAATTSSMDVYWRRVGYGLENCTRREPYIHRGPYRHGTPLSLMLI